MTENKQENEFEVVYKMISDFRRKKYSEQVGESNFCDFEISLNESIVLLLKNALAAESIGKKAAEFYIFETELQNAVLILERRKYRESPLREGQVFAPKYSATIKNGCVQ